MTGELRPTSDVIRDAHYPRDLDWAIGLDVNGHPSLSLVVDGTAIVIPHEALIPLVRSLGVALRDMRRYGADLQAAADELGNGRES